VLGIIAGVLVLGCAVCGLALAGVGFFAKTVAGPAIVVDQYYSAVKNQDYTTAFSNMEPGTTTFRGQVISQQAYMVAAQGLDTLRGKVSSFSVAVPSVTNNSASVTVTVNRTNAAAYDVQLQLQQVNGSWKIVSFDNI
jgi:hypothetical protein